MRSARESVQVVQAKTVQFVKMRPEPGVAVKLHGYAGCAAGGDAGGDSAAISAAAAGADDMTTRRHGDLDQAAAVGASHDSAAAAR